MDESGVIVRARTVGAVDCHSADNRCGIVRLLTISARGWGSGVSCPGMAATPLLSTTGSGSHPARAPIKLSPMHDDITERLELKIAFLERASAELSDVVYAQQREIASLQARLEALASRLEAVSILLGKFLAVLPAD